MVILEDRTGPPQRAISDLLHGSYVHSTRNENKEMGRKKKKKTGRKGYG